MGMSSNTTSPRQPDWSGPASCWQLLVALHSTSHASTTHSGVHKIGASVENRGPLLPWAGPTTIPSGAAAW